MQIINWLHDNVDQLVAASNITTGLFLFILSAIIIKFVITHKFSNLTDLRTMLIGLALLCAGIGIHRGYWAVWRVSEILNWEQIHQFTETNVFLTIIPIFISILGASLMISPAVAMYINAKNKWGCYIAVLFFSICLYLSIFLKIKQLEIGLLVP